MEGIGAILDAARANLRGASGSRADESFEHRRGLEQQRGHGLDVLVKLREMDPKALVVVASADIQSSTRTMAYEAGALGFIHKPFVPEQVIAAVETALAEGATSETN